MKIWTLLILITAIAIVACEQADPASFSPQPTDTMPPDSEATAVVIRDTPTISVEASPEGKPTATETMDPEPSPSPIVEVDIAETEEQSQPSGDEAIIVNGVYEQTFFRGQMDAPVTMIDYSDFL
jgi:hypothetical protein